MAKHIAPPATYEQLVESLGMTPEEIEFVDRILKEVEEEEGALDSDIKEEDSSDLPSLWYSSPMKKHIAPPATYEQLTESLNLSPEEIALVDRVIEKVLKEEALRTGNGRDGASFEAKKGTQF